MATPWGLAVDEEHVIARGYRARVFLQHDDTQQAFDEIRMQLFLDWQAARTEREREGLHAVAQALDRIQAQFRAWSDELTKRNL